MNHRIGSCSLCGGDVNVFTGPYFGAPPPPTCAKCHAVRDQRAQLLQQSGNLCMQLGLNTSEVQEASPDDVAHWIVDGEGGFY